MTQTQTYNLAVGFAANVIRTATDWQEVQNALWNNDKVRGWLLDRNGGDEDACGDDLLSIIRQAEEQLGDDLPSSYSD